MSIRRYRHVRHRSFAPEYDAKRQADKYSKVRTAVFIAAPPLLGGVGAYIQKKHQDNKKAELKAEIKKVEQDFQSFYRENAYSLAGDLLRNPRAKEMLLNIRAGKGFDRSELLNMATKTVLGDSAFVLEFLERREQANTKIAQLDSELKDVENNANNLVGITFAAVTASLYVPLLVISLYKHFAALRMAARKEEEKPKIEDIPKPVQRPSPVPEAPLATITPKSLPAVRNGKNGKTSEVPDLDALVFGKREEERPSEPEAKTEGLFAADTSAALQAKGLDPKTMERGLIKAFKVLSRNSIYVGERYAQVPDVLRDLRKAVGDDDGKILEVLKSEGALYPHKGDDCISLQSKPSGALGKMIMRDIAARLVKMSRAHK